MSNNNRLRNRLKIIILIFVGLTSFIGSLLINIFGFKSTINKENDFSGLASFSSRNTKVKTSVNSIKDTSNEKNSEIPVVINSSPLLQLYNNKWDRIKAKFSGFELDKDGNAVFSKGYTLYCNGKYVNYIIFNSKYNNSVVENLKVGADFSTVEKVLGNPTFKSDKFLGYKTTKGYVFFYKDEIVVYPNRKISNKKLEEFFQDYFEKTYGKDRAYFVADIRKNFEDIIVSVDEENDVVILKSSTRQVIAKLDALGNIEVEFFDGYNISKDSTKEFIDKKIYSINENDLVEIMEKERISVR